MFEICVFAGTTEGRRLVKFLRGQAGQVLVCVATEYGEALISRGENVEVAAGRLNRDGMEALLANRHFDAVVDATHPFATEVSRNLAAACAATGTEYLRLSRAQAEADGDAVYVDSVEAAADFLAARSGNALVATGAKHLEPYRRVPDHENRLWARVLPMAESLSACTAAGFTPAHVIAMQGPFSAEMNAATLRSIRADWLVTKDSGDVGGLREKLEAARQAGAKCVVVGRPEQTGGYSFAEIVARLTERFGLEDAREIDIVSAGMGSMGTLTLDARDALERCDCVIGAPRLMEALKGFGKPSYAAINPDDICDLIAAHPEHRRVAVAMSGDAGFFSGAKKLLPKLAGHRVRVLPGVSSLQALCAKVGASWDDVRAVSLHGREGSIVPELRRHGKVFALLGGADGLKALCTDLCAANLSGARLTVGQRLSYPDEAVFTGTAAEFADVPCDPLCVVLIEHATENRVLPVGLPDEAFIREAVPMTKSEVRAVSVSKLRLSEDAVVWDVGAGTGSVSVECALLCPKGRVYAIERKPEAVALIKQNAERFGARNLEIVEGEAPEALRGLPAPSHAFIGGSGGNLRDIIAAVTERNPSARIVVNAIAPESLGEIANIAQTMEFDHSELVQLTVARSKEAGRVHLMEGMNPVWVAALWNDGGGEAR